MQAKKASGLDEYSRTARLKPALLVILPISLLLGELGLKVSVASGLLATSASACGLTYLASQLCRDIGKKKESALFEMWGGKPTVAKLRHRNDAINPHTRTRYHQRSAKLGFSLPAQYEEVKNPLAADLRYEAFGNHLLERTRDTVQFSLLFQELMNYGFRRNLWAMKSLGIFLCVLSVVVQILMCGYQYFIQRTIPVGMAVVLAVDALLLFVWIAFINPDWVRVAADAYADRLLGASELLT
jgi:hypothetical protein